MWAIYENTNKTTMTQEILTALREFGRMNWQMDSLGERTREILLDHANIPLYLELIGNPDFITRTDAEWALVSIGLPAKDGLIDALHSPNPFARQTAASSLWRMRDPSVVQELITLLKDEDARVRAAAAESLGFIGGNTAVPDLLDALNNENDFAFEHIVYALREIVETEPELHSQITGHLSDADPKIRAGIAYALGEKAGVEGIQSFLDLVRVGVSGDRHEWERAVKSLVHIGSPAIPQMVELLKDDDEVMRILAAEVIGNIGNKVALPELIKASIDEDRQVRQAVYWAIGEMGETAVPFLVEALQKVDDDDAWDVGRAVTDLVLNNPNSSAIEALIELLGSADDKVRKRAINALRVIGANSRNKRLLDRISQLLRDDNPNLQNSAVEILTQIRTPEALVALEEWRKQQGNG